MPIGRCTQKAKPVQGASHTVKTVVSYGHYFVPIQTLFTCVLGQNGVQRTLLFYSTGIR